MVLFSRPVEPARAEQVAKAFLPERTLRSCTAFNGQLWLARFEEGGFAFIPRDDAFPPLLGYASDAPAERMPPALEAHCELFSRQIREHVSASAAAHPDWSAVSRPGFRKASVRAETGPLIGSTWDQSPYYNDQFPYFTLSGHTDQQAYAGCVGIVMGQLMRYHRHPPRGVGRRSYYSHTTDSTLNAGFDTTYYDWDNMPDSLCTSAGVLTAHPDEVDEVSRLLYHAAVSVEMELQPEGSSSTYEDMVYALIGHFDYSPSMEIYHADSSTAAEWRALLKTELDSAYPVPYRGQGDDGGHAYLLDGYRVETETYFHINWGWGGSFDGWYLLSALTPAEGYDYSENPAAVLGVRKNTDDIIRFAYSGFEAWNSGWTYDGFGFVSENGVYDMVHSGELAYAFDGPDQWLITPRVHIPDSDQAELRFWAKMLNTGRQCRVLLSEGDTTRSNFTTELGTVAPHDENWAEYSFNLRSFRNKDVHIAFHFDQTNGYISIDDLMMSYPGSLTGTRTTVPRDPFLLEVYPNPFNPVAHIRYELARPARVRIAVFDVRGRQVAVPAEHPAFPGTYTLQWDASGLGSGVYFCVLYVDGKPARTRKTLLVK